MKTIFDPRKGYPTEVTELPAVKDGFVWLNGELREVNEIHSTAQGCQMELFS